MRVCVFVEWYELISISASVFMHVREDFSSVLSLGENKTGLGQSGT